MFYTVLSQRTSDEDEIRIDLSRDSSKPKNDATAHYSEVLNEWV